MYLDSIEILYSMVNGIEYTREIPKEAEQFAKEHGFIVIVGGSDDLMYCYGAESYLTDYCEHSYGWDGDDLINIRDKQLKYEAEQLGLEIYWCGLIKGTNKKIENYSVEKSGAFSYKVKDGIEFKNFIVFEDKTRTDVYCTGIIIALPQDFKSFSNIECD